MCLFNTIQYNKIQYNTIQYNNKIMIYYNENCLQSVLFLIVWSLHNFICFVWCVYTIQYNTNTILHNNKIMIDYSEKYLYNFWV